MKHRHYCYITACPLDDAGNTELQTDELGLCREHDVSECDDVIIGSIILMKQVCQVKCDYCPPPYTGPSTTTTTTEGPKGRTGLIYWTDSIKN